MEQCGKCWVWYEQGYGAPCPTDCSSGSGLSPGDRITFSWCNRNWTGTLKRLTAERFAEIDGWTGDLNTITGWDIAVDNRGTGDSGDLQCITVEEHDLKLLIEGN